MSLPSRKDIEFKAREIKFKEEVARGLPAITSERSELSEGGYLRRAQEDLMRRNSAVVMQQRQYLDEMAGEMGLVVLSRRNHKHLEKQAGWRNFLRRRGLSVVRFRKEPPIRARAASIESQRKAKKVLKPKDLSKVKYRTTHGINGIRPVVPQRKYAPDLLKVSMIGLKGGVPISTPKPKATKKTKRKKKKIGKIASNRNGRKPRKLKGFVFGDDVWKVRTRRRKR